MKSIRWFPVLLFAVLFGATSLAPVSGQPKKGISAKAATFQLYTDKGGKYRFRLLDADGNKLAMSIKGYKTKKEISDIVAQIRSVAVRASIDDQTKK